MTKRILAAAAVLACTVLPLAAYAQPSGVAAGATTGAVGGAIVGGPIGAVVGGVGGAIIGGLSDEQRPRFRDGVRDYRYTIVNDRTVLVDPRTHRIIEIIE